VTFGFVPRVVTVFLLFYLAAKLLRHEHNDGRAARQLGESPAFWFAIAILILMAASAAAIWTMVRPMPERILPADGADILEYCAGCGIHQYPLQLTLGDEIELLGYDLSADQVRPGNAVELTLYWHALTELEQDFTVFSHLLGESHNPTSGSFLWGQSDGIPVHGSYPTSHWLANETVVDRHAIVVQPSAPQGCYQIEVGMYVLETGQRLPVVDAEGSTLSEDRALLEARIEVRHPE
jgi:hypothetical protein